MVKNSNSISLDNVVWSIREQFADKEFRKVGESRGEGDTVPPAEAEVKNSMESTLQAADRGVEKI